MKYLVTIEMLPRFELLFLAGVLRGGWLLDRLWQSGNVYRALLLSVFQLS